MLKNVAPANKRSVLGQIALQTLAILLDRGQVSAAQQYAQTITASFPDAAPTEHKGDWLVATGLRPASWLPTQNRGDRTREMHLRHGVRKEKSFFTQMPAISSSEQISM